MPGSNRRSRSTCTASEYSHSCRVPLRSRASTSSALRCVRAPALRSIGPVAIPSWILVPRAAPAARRRARRPPGLTGIACRCAEPRPLRRLDEMRLAVRTRGPLVLLSGSEPGARLCLRVNASGGTSRRFTTGISQVAETGAHEEACRIGGLPMQTRSATTEVLNAAPDAGPLAPSLEEGSPSAGPANGVVETGVAGHDRYPRGALVRALVRRRSRSCRSARQRRPAGSSGSSPRVWPAPARRQPESDRPGRH